MADENTKPNPENLPVIEETSLHRIATTVKLYQEFKTLGKDKFEEIYGKADPKSLEGFCYKKYYKGKSKNERFGLVRKYESETKNSPLEGWTAERDGVFLELGEYLKVYLEIDEKKSKKNPQRKVVTKIKSKNSFYWKEWNFEEDIEREDWSDVVKKDNRNKIIGNFVKLTKKINSEFGDEESDAQHSISSLKSFVNYEFSIQFDSTKYDSKITIGGNKNPYNHMNIDDGRIFFLSLNLNSAIFKKRRFWEVWNFFTKFPFIFQDFPPFLNVVSVYFSKNVGVSMFEFIEDKKNKDEINFRRSVFSHKTEFKDCRFESDVIFTSSVFKSRCHFNRAILSQETVFKHCTFKGPLSFEEAKFLYDQSSINLEYATMKYKINLSYLGLKECQKLIISFQYSYLEKRLYFSLAGDTLYQNVTLRIRNTEFSSVFCDDYSFHKTKLWYTENKNDRQEFLNYNKYAKLKKELSEEEMKKKEEELKEEKKELSITEGLKIADTIEQAISERRVFRKILQDLHWGDKADEEYARIMDLELKLKKELKEWLHYKKSRFKFFKCSWHWLNINVWEYWVYKKAFGWGVRIQNIILTSMIFIGFFALIYALYDFFGWIIEITGDQGLRYILPEGGIPILSHFRFSVWNSFLLADLSLNYGWLITFISTIQGVLGIIYVTVLVAIISRKFMRM